MSDTRSDAEVQDTSIIEVLKRAIWDTPASAELSPSIAPRWVAEIVERLEAMGYRIVPVEPTEAMVERVARLLCLQLGLNPDAPVYRGPATGPMHQASTWDCFANDARAVIAALIEAAGATRTERCAEHGVIYPAGGRCGLCAEEARR